MYKNKGRVNALLNAPWQTFAIIIGIGGLLLWKIGILDTLSGFFTKTEAEKQAALLQKFDTINSTGNSTWSAERIRSDANSVANAFGVLKGTSWYSGWTEDEDTAINILKNYTNASVRNSLFVAYTTLATDGRDLKIDAQNFLTTSQVTYLRLKAII